MNIALHRISAIVDSLKRGRCVLCVSSRLDTGKSVCALIETLLHELEELDEPEAPEASATPAMIDWQSARRVLKTQPLTAAAYVRRHLGDRFLPALARATRTANVPSSVHLLAELPFRSVITTSLGHGFERSTFDGAVYTAHDTSLLYLDNRERHLFKVLGDVKDPGTIVWTASDVRTVLTDIERRATIGQMYSGCNFLFLGFAPDDPDFGIVLEHVLLPASDIDAEHYAVMPGISAMEREELSSAYNISVLDQDDEVKFICEVRDALGEGADAGARRSLERDEDAGSSPMGERVEACLARLERDPDDQEALVELAALDQVLRRSRDHERLVDLYVGRVGIATVPAQRAELLRELSDIFEYEMDDLERAFRARLASFESAPRVGALPELERLAAATGGWQELLDHLHDHLETLEHTERAGVLLEMARLADEHMDDADYALGAVDTALDMDPGSARALSFRLSLLRRHGLWQALAESLEAVLETDLPPVVRADRLAELADIHDNHLGDPARALDYYRRALESDPWAMDARLAYEALLRRRESHGELMHSLEHRLEQASLHEQVEIRRELAELCDQVLGMRVLATRYYEDLRADAPADLGVLRALTRLYQEQGCIRECIEMLSTQLGVVEDNRERTEICLAMAEKWGQLGSESDVRECLEWALAYGGATDEIFASLEASYRKVGNWHALIDMYARRIKQAPAAERVGLYRAMAQIHERELGDQGSAIDAYLAVLDESPGHEDTLDELTRLYEAREAFDELLEVLERRAEHSAASERVELLRRAGRIALTRMDEGETAMALFERALEAVPGHIPTLRALADLHCEHGHPERAMELLEQAALATESRRERNALFMEQAALHERAGSPERAAALYRQVLDIDPTHTRAAARLADHLWETDNRGASIPLLRTLVERAPEPRYALRLALAADRAGDAEEAERAFARAVALSPEDREILSAYSQFSLERKNWARAQELGRELARLYDASLTGAQYADLHHGLALCALRLGDTEDARRQVKATLATRPNHRPTLELSLELSRGDAEACLATLSTLLETAQDDDDRARLLGQIAAIELRDKNVPDKALLLLEQALSYRPDDHLLLHEYLDVLVAKKSWEQAITVLDQLIGSERAPDVRAKYRYTAAMLRLEELGERDRARALLEQALDEDPTLERAFVALEELLAEDREWDALKERYCTAIQSLGPGQEPGERTRLSHLWSALGKLCAGPLDDIEEAICSYEVALRLSDDPIDAYRALAPLYAQAGPQRLDKATAAYHALVRADKGDLESYRALEELYIRAEDRRHALRLGNAVTLLEMQESGRMPRLRTERILDLSGPPLDPAWWDKIRHPELDRRLSALLAMVTPVLVAAQARPLKRLGLDEARRVQPGDSRRFAEILRHVARTLAVSLPATYDAPSQEAAVRVLPCTTGRDSGLVVALGPQVVDNLSEREILFYLARHLAALQSELSATALLSGPDDVAEVLGAILAASSASGKAASRKTASGKTADPVTTLSRALETQLQPAAFERMCTIAGQLRGQDGPVDTRALARTWWRAAHATAARIALAMGNDLALCVRMLMNESQSSQESSKDPGARGAASQAQDPRIPDLVWSSITDDLIAVTRYLAQRGDDGPAA